MPAVTEASADRDGIGHHPEVDSWDNAEGQWKREISVIGKSLHDVHDLYGLLGRKYVLCAGKQ